MEKSYEDRCAETFNRRLLDALEKAGVLNDRALHNLRYPEEEELQIAESDPL